MIYKNILLVGCIFVLVLMAQKLFLKSYMSGGLCCYFVISSFFSVGHKKGKIMESSSLLTRNIFPVLDFWFLRQHAGECGYWVAASWLWRTSKTNALWALLCAGSGLVFYYEAQITWSSCELFLSRLSHLCESQRCNHSLRREKRGSKKRGNLLLQSVAPSAWKGIKRPSCGHLRAAFVSHGAHYISLHSTWFLTDALHIFLFVPEFTCGLVWGWLMCQSH